MVTCPTKNARKSGPINVKDKCDWRLDGRKSKSGPIREKCGNMELGHRLESGYRATETEGCTEMTGGACGEVSTT